MMKEPRHMEIASVSGGLPPRGAPSSRRLLQEPPGRRRSPAFRGTPSRVRAALALAAASVLACLSPAGSPAQDAARPAKGLTVHLLAAEILPGADTVVLRSGESLGEPIQLPTNNLSEPIQVTGRNLELLGPAAGEEPAPVLGRAALPDAGRRFLLLLVPAGNRYRCLPVRLDDPAFKAGDVCFFNLSPVEVAGTLGSRRFSIAGGKSVVTRPPPRDDLPYYQVRIACRQGERTRMIADTRWPHDDQHRSYVIFFSKGDRITYRAIDEPAPAADE